MDVLGSEGVGYPGFGIPSASNVSEYPFGIFRYARWGHPKPRTGRFCVQSNTPYGVAFSLPLVAVPAHPRRKDGGCRRRSKSFSWCGFCMGIDIFSFAAYNNSTRQATACVCQSVEVRECAGRHCLTELARGVVQ